MPQYLGLLGAENLNDIIEYLLSSDAVEQRFKDKFINNKLIPEYVMFEENDYYFTYHYEE